MPQIHLNDRIFSAVQRQAATEGYATLEAYLTDVLDHHLGAEVDNLDSLFTPERLAHIDQADADIKAGHFYTEVQAEIELAKRRAAWLQKNPR